MFETPVSAARRAAGLRRGARLEAAEGAGCNLSGRSPTICAEPRKRRWPSGAPAGGPVMFEALTPNALREVAGAAGARWLRGVDSWEVPVSASRCAAGLRRGARLGVVEGAGHNPLRASPGGLRGAKEERAKVGLAGTGDV